MSRFSSRVLPTIAAFAIVLVLVPMVTAQPPGGRGGGRGRGGFGFGGGGFGFSGLQLAAQVKEVQEALKLSEEQVGKVTEINDKLRDDRRELFQQGGGDFQAMRADMEKLQDEANAKLAEVLDEGQQKRLMGIQIQVAGAASLFDKTIAEELGVTEDQRSQLREAQQEIGEAMQDAMAELRDKDLSREEMMAEMGKLRDRTRDENDKKLLAVLTEDQQDQYESLKGEKVEIDMSQFRGRGFGGPGGPGGRGGQDGRGRRGGRNRDNGGDNANSDRGV